MIINETAGLENKSGQEWLSVDKTCELIGVGRNVVYHLINKGLIKTAALKLSETTRTGRRLVNAKSVLEYLEQIATGGKGK